MLEDNIRARERMVTFRPANLLRVQRRTTFGQWSLTDGT
jgi:hypothetical protein